jgi:hypothetical protein
VVLVNEHDGRFESKSKDAISIDAGDTVDNRNIAAAYSQCTGCRTVAVAVQAVLATGPATTVSPQNLALAINQDCSSCVTMAWAYQYVATTGGDIKLAEDTRQRFHALGNQIKTLIDQPLTYEELDARLDALVHEMWGSIAYELKQAGKEAGKPDKRADIDVDQGATPAPTGSETAPDPSPEPSDAPTPEPSPTPTPTPTESAIVLAGIGRWARRAGNEVST